MTLTKRIIPCLDVKDGRTVKGIQFENLADMGDPVTLGRYYADQGADELVFLDITATGEKRKTLTELVKRIAAEINIPFTVGGGINTVNDVAALLEAGADKVSINTAAIRRPGVISELAAHFGNQCIVTAIDAKNENGNWMVYGNAGSKATGMRVTDWAKEVAERGAGEILLTSISNDGTQSGFAVALTKEVTMVVNVPVIASGGAGNETHFYDVFADGKADAALAAGIFHTRKLEIPVLKQYLKSKKIAVR
ncbi:imidazole glycerol phosphate synthase subunit HisF [Chitinophagaceae bacterium MMS25-I14]